MINSEDHWNKYPDKQSFYWLSSGARIYNVLFAIDEKKHNEKLIKASKTIKCLKCEAIIKTGEKHFSGVCFGCGKLKKITE
jgi:hypothetical protein